MFPLSSFSLTMRPLASNSQTPGAASSATKRNPGCGLLMYPVAMILVKIIQSVHDVCAFLRTSLKILPGAVDDDAAHAAVLCV